jgi:hypothetical protein
MRCRHNVFTEPLPSNDRGIYIQTHTLRGGIYEVRRRDGLGCDDIHTKFHKYWSSQSKFEREDTQTHRQHGDLMSPLLLFQKKESRLKPDWERRFECIN